MDTDDLYRLLRTSHAQAQGIVDTIVDPLLVLDADLCVQAAGRSFFKTFQVDRYETIGRRIYELGDGQWDIPELRRLLVEVIPRSAAVIDYRVEHAFPGLGQRTMLATARTTGMAMGIALAGGKPVAEIQFADYIFNTIDLLKLVGNCHWSSYGQYHLPLVVMTLVCVGYRHPLRQWPCSDKKSSTPSS